MNHDCIWDTQEHLIEEAVTNGAKTVVPSGSIVVVVKRMAFYVFLGLITFGCASRSGRRTSHSVSYEVSGATDGASVTYKDEGGGTQQLTVGLPWNKQLVSREGALLYISAQNKEDYGTITVKIIIDGKTVKTDTSPGGYSSATASTYCCE